MEPSKYREVVTLKKWEEKAIIGQLKGACWQYNVDLNVVEISKAWTEVTLGLEFRSKDEKAAELMAKHFRLWWDKENVAGEMCMDPTEKGLTRQIEKDPMMEQFA